MEKHILSKSTFIRGTQCLKSLYLNKKRPFLRDRLGDVQRAKFKRGTDVGVLAQQLFPNGINLKPKSPSQYRKKVAETAEIIHTQSYQTLYEAAFQYDQLLILLDILVKDQEDWTAYEVKSSLGVSETYLQDAAFQYYVITNSGIRLTNFFLVTINPDYLLNEDVNIQQLFTQHNVTKKVKDRQEWIKQQVEKEKEILQLPHSPKIDIGLQCNHPYPCDFQGHCWKKVAENSLLYLDAFPEEDRFENYYSGKDTPQIQDQTLCTKAQQIQLQSAIQKKIYLNRDQIKSALQPVTPDSIFLNCYFVRPAIPVLQNTVPYQAIPVAASSGRMDNSNKIDVFFPSENPFEQFISYLRNLLINHVKIVCYDFTTIISFLESIHEDKLLAGLKEKFIDLKILFDNQSVYHYHLRGDYSPQQISKVILNEFVRELNPALLSMNWQKSLFNKEENFAELKEQTEYYLEKSDRFNRKLLHFLQEIPGTLEG